MSKLVVMREDYIAYPEALADGVKEFIAFVKDNLPDVVRKAQSSSFPPLNFMDGSYKSWIKKSKVGKRIKKRHVHKVSDRFLREAQAKVQQLFHLPSLDCVYSYKEGLSAASCARQHVGTFAILKLDIKDYFPSITQSMIHRMYQQYFDDLWTQCKASLVKNHVTKTSLDEIAKIIAIICTRSDTRDNGNTTEPILPIGIEPAATISNHVLIEVDRYLQAECRKRKLTYSRYSDNLFISSGKDTGHIDRDFQEEVKKCINEFDFDGKHPFAINERKTRYIPMWRCQRMLGVVVNVKMSVPKKRDRWVRSALNHLYHDSKQLYDTVVSRGADHGVLSRSYGRMFRRAQRVYGQLSYIYSIMPSRYHKYSSQHHASKMLLEEVSHELNAYAEEIAGQKAAAQANAKGGTV